MCENIEEIAELEDTIESLFEEDLSSRELEEECERKQNDEVEAEVGWRRQCSFGHPRRSPRKERSPN